MTEKEVSEITPVMAASAYALSHNDDYRVFLEGYIELAKEKLSMSESHDEFEENKLKRDMLLSFAASVRAYANAHEETIKQLKNKELNDGKKEGY